MADSDLVRSPGLELGPGDRFFHYTSSAGLFGILQSGCLWATHYRFLNDSKEFTAARASLEKFIEKQIHILLARLKVNHGFQLDPDLDRKAVASEEAQRLVDAFYDATLGNNDGGLIGVDGYVFSGFCCGPDESNAFNNGGLLNWATYGRDGGFALQFNPNKLETLLKEETTRQPTLAWMFQRAVYADEGEIPAALQSQYDDVGKIAQRLSEQGIRGTGNVKVELETVAAPLAQIICLLKDSYFSLEKEARLVVLQPQRQRPGVRSREVCIRHINNMPIPYIKLLDGILLGQNCPIERIVAGPHPDTRRRLVALRAFLESRGIKDIKITASDVPYVTS